MERFNLIEEPWIAVITDDKGTTKEVSLADLFRHAHEYRALAGETPAQDFAILRFLLAILYTVFSRFDHHGKKYERVKLDNRLIQQNELMGGDDEEDYLEAVNETWEGLWESESFPDIIQTYLETWKDRFNLFDDSYPFYQVTAEDLTNMKIEKTGEISLKLINRLISESNNKIGLFSPASEMYKNDLSLSSLARWLVAFQGYTGTGDKAKFPNMKVSASKGWLLGLGGIYLSGETLKETLLLNMVLLNKSPKQTPVWEKDIDLKVNDLLREFPNNLSELYTNWSRLMLIESNEKIRIQAVQLPGINPQEFYLEQMTLWRYPKSGNDKDHYVPKPHNVNQSFWRSFGLLSMQSDSANKHRKPGIIDWHNNLVNKGYLQGNTARIVSVGLSYNRDASTMPNNEIFDEIDIANEVLADVAEKGWVSIIMGEIETTKFVIEIILKNYAADILKIRNLSNLGFIDTVIQDAYYAIDSPFREWLSMISPNDSKNDRVLLWRETLKKVVISQAENILNSSGNRDFLGTMVKIGDSDPKHLNIEIAYNRFMANLIVKLQ